jgi:hypothetical protein
MDELEKQVGRFVFATNSPFKVVEHPEFLKMMNMVRPSIKLPKRQTVGGRILDAVYVEEWKAFTSSLDGKYCTMAMDGWSTLTNQPYIAILLGNHLVDTIDTTGNAHTGEYLAKLMEDGLEKVRLETKAVVVGLHFSNFSIFHSLSQPLSLTMLPICKICVQG